MEHVRVQHTIQALSICVYTCQVDNSKSINIKIKVAPNPYSNFIDQGWLAHLSWPCKKGHDKTTGGLHIDGVVPMHWDKYDDLHDPQRPPWWVIQKAPALEAQCWWLAARDCMWKQNKLEISICAWPVIQFQHSHIRLSLIVFIKRILQPPWKSIKCQGASEQATRMAALQIQTQMPVVL